MQRLQKQAERLDRWLQENQAKYGTTKKEISSNVTDNDSAKMRTSHGVVQGYNSQALTDGKHQVIIHAEAFGRGQDHAHGPPMLEEALENLKSLGHSEDYFAGKIFTADTIYHIETNIRKCLDLRLDAYIPDLFFRRRDPRYVTQRRYWPRRKTFILRRIFPMMRLQINTCAPTAKRLKRKVRFILRDGLVQRGYIANEQDCQSCPLRSRCLTARGGKRRYLWGTIGAELTNLSKRMAAKIDTEAGRKIYPQRFAVVEPVFANIRTQKRLDRFILRGKVKVNI